MSYITNPVEPSKTRRLARWRFPIAVILVFGGAFAFPWAWNALGIEADFPVPLSMAMLWLAPPIGIVLLAAWWLLFSGVPWGLRLLVLLIPLLAAPVAYLYCVRSIELTTTAFGLVPRFHFSWEPTAQEQWNAFQQTQREEAGLPPINGTVGPEDFAEYRGPKRDGVITHLRLATDWKQHPPKVLWEHPCVGGYSGIAVAGNIVVTLEQRYGQEVVACYDRETGRERWNLPYDAYHRDRFGDGPRSTPTIHAGLIFTLGAVGDLVCTDVDGNKKWAVNILKECKAKNIMWGLSGSPLIVDDLVIAHAGIDPDAPVGEALVAFDYKTGRKRWSIGARKAGYSSPQLAVLDGVPQILLFDGEALAGFDPKVGNELWEIPWVTKMEMNMIQPLVVGEDRVFISSEATNGCALYRIKAPTEKSQKWQVENLWHTKSIGTRFANPVTDGKRIFGLHNLAGILKCIDVADGGVLWTGDRYGPGQLLLVDDLLLIVSGNGEVSVVRPGATATEVLARMEVFADKTWNTPALAGNQLFVRNQFKITCLQLPRK